MALVASPLFQAQLDFWGSSNPSVHHHINLQPPEQMAAIMSYQYPPPPPNGADMGIPPSGYMSGYEGMPSSSDMEMRANRHGFPRDRRDSSEMKLKRSISTPTVRQAMPQQPPPHMPQSQHQSQQDAMLSGEKRRNKLGYHRTSVACGHCRRRKIRCIPSADDPQSKCVNCIRLKKDCSFHSVDQQPQLESRHKAVPRPPMGPGKIVSASTSPAIPASNQGDMHGQFAPQMAMPSMQPMAPPALKPSPADHLSVAATRSFEFGSMTNWMAPDASPSSSKPDDINSSWRPYSQEAPATPATFSPYTPHASAPWTPSGVDATREDMSWSYPPPRSMSFSSDTLSSPINASQYPSISQQMTTARSFDGKPSTGQMYPAPITTTIAGVTPLDHGVPLSAGAVPTAMGFGAWQQQQAQYPFVGKPGDSYGQWNGENGGSEHPADGQAHAGALYYTGR